MPTCKRCGGEVRATTVGGIEWFGHVRNPGRDHHYVTLARETDPAAPEPNATVAASRRRQGEPRKGVRVP